MERNLEFSSDKLTAAKLPVVRRELDAIEKRDGLVLPQAVVARAKSKSSPLHDYFEWDNRKCGVAHRLRQARELISYVQVQDLSQGEDSPKVRAYVNIRTTEELSDDPPVRGYVSIGRVLASDTMTQQMLDNAWRYLQLWKKKFGNLKAFAEVTEVIDHLEKKRSKKPNRKKR